MKGEEDIVLFLLFTGCDTNKKPQSKVVRTPYGYDCIKIYSGEGFSSIECWDSEGPPKKK